MRWKVLVPGVVVALAVVVAVLLLTGGESRAEKAMSDVCDARADIAQPVKTLQRLTPSTATTSQIKDSVQAIRNDLSKIASARADLADEDREQVQAANDAFVATVKDTASPVGRSQSLESAATQLEQAFQQLASSYRSTYGKIDCGQPT